MNLMETILSGGKEWSRVTKNTKPKKTLKNRRRTEKVKPTSSQVILLLGRSVFVRMQNHGTASAGGRVNGLK